MIDITMRILSKPVPFKSFLSITVALSLLPGAISQAQSYQSYPNVVVQTDSLTGMQPSYSSTQSLPDLSPDAIASDVVSNFDPLTGRTEYMAQDFDPFEQDNQIAGSARLRSASSGITRDGASVAGGAYLDISVVYTSESRDTWDGKRLEHGVYMSGQPVDYMTYDIQSLDCQRDVTYVTYDDSYYRGASYGYLGGLYRPFPRYRGSSRYYRECDRIRYGNWRGLRDNYVDYSGYDERWGRNARLRSDIRESVREIVTGEDDNGYIDDSRPIGERGDRDNVQERDLIMRMRDQRSITSYNVIASDRLGDRRLDESSQDLSSRPIASRRNSVSTQVRTRSPISQRRSDIDAVRDSGASAGVPRLSNAVPRLSSPRRSLPSRTPEIQVPVQRSTPSERRRSTRPVRTEAPRAQAPRAQAPRAQAPRAQTPKPSSSRSSSKPRTQTKPARSSRSSERTKPSRSSSSNRSSKPKSSRSVNRSFGGRGSKPSPRVRRYYSGGSQTDRFEQTRCIKEERITVHIPEDRLLAARFDGLSIALLDQHGQDIPVYIPPNYVEGFIKANPYLGQYGSTAPRQTSPSGYYPTNPIR